MLGWTLRAVAPAQPKGAAGPTRRQDREKKPGSAWAGAASASMASNLRSIASASGSSSWRVVAAAASDVEGGWLKLFGLQY